MKIEKNIKILLFVMFVGFFKDIKDLTAELMKVMDIPILLFPIFFIVAVCYVGFLRRKKNYVN